MSDSIKVRVYTSRDRSAWRDVEAPPGKPIVFEDDPYFYGWLGWWVPVESRPATLYIYTNDSVREPNPLDTSAWSGPTENGLPFGGGIPPEDDQPFCGEWWGRVMFYVEPGLTR